MSFAALTVDDVFAANLGNHSGLYQPGPEQRELTCELYVAKSSSNDGFHGYRVNGQIPNGPSPADGIDDWTTPIWNDYSRWVISESAHTIQYSMEQFYRITLNYNPNTLLISGYKHEDLATGLHPEATYCKLRQVTPAFHN